MNIIDDTEILKAVFSGIGRSRYRLKEELSKKLKNVNYPTLRRRIFELSNEGYVRLEPGIRKNGNPDKRRTGKPELTFKGLVFLILNASLDESQTRAIVQKVLSESTFKNIKIYYAAASEIGTVSIQKAIEQIRPRVNLEHYDEEYVRNLWHDTVVENYLDEVLSYMKKHFPSEEKLERHFKKAKAKKDLTKLPSEAINIAYVVYEHLKSKRQSYSDRIDLLKPFIKVFDKAGVKP